MARFRKTREGQDKASHRYFVVISGLKNQRHSGMEGSIVKSCVIGSGDIQTKQFKPPDENTSQYKNTAMHRRYEKKKHDRRQDKRYDKMTVSCFRVSIDILCESPSPSCLVLSCLCSCLCLRQSLTVTVTVTVTLTVTLTLAHA